MISEQDENAYRTLGKFLGAVGVASAGLFDTREKLLRHLQGICTEFEQAEQQRKQAMTATV